jgi:hypothetical protein
MADYTVYATGGLFSTHTVCGGCGALVHDREAHDRFHEGLAIMITALTEEKLLAVALKEEEK